MELQRAALSQLEDWRLHHPDQALLVTGARQVGKTYLITRFLEGQSEGYVAFDLLEDVALAQSLHTATSAEDIMLRLSAAASAPLVQGQTTIFIDEVQAVPEIVTQIKYLVAKYDYRFVLSGSLLGVALENIRSLPVGFVFTVQIFPLDFEEFATAAGAVSALEQAQEAFKAGQPIPDFVHTRLLKLFHQYLLIGGMPAAVSDFFEHNNLQTVRQIQSNINLLYKADISKYAPKSSRLTVQHIFELIPRQLTQTNRRFQFSSIPDVRRFRNIANEFLWLVQAGVAIQVNQVQAPVSPLLASYEENKFKLFCSDVGLLTSQYSQRLALQILGADSNTAMGNSPARQDDSATQIRVVGSQARNSQTTAGPKVNLGSIYENYAAQELTAHRFQPFYFTKHGIGELDFLIESRDGDVIAFEVKSGKDYATHAALDNARQQKSWNIDHAIVLAETNVKTSGSITYMPPYLLSQIRNT